MSRSGMERKTDCFGETRPVPHVPSSSRAGKRVCSYYEYFHSYIIHIVFYHIILNYIVLTLFYVVLYYFNINIKIVVIVIVIVVIIIIAFDLKPCLRHIWAADTV